jgi:NAD(P)-dependent dehydrogenase (short-subunit alcohol dehydrogenase family)
MQKQGKTKPLRPKQEQQERPGREFKMRPRPQAEKPEHRGSAKLEGKVAIITGGDSGIGRAVAVAFAKEGADIVVSYLNEHRDAEETRRLVQAEDRRCEIVAGDVGDATLCEELVRRTIKQFGRLDVIVNNAAEQHPQKDIRKISPQQLERTFRTNIFSFFFLAQAALPHLKEGSAIINTTSVTAYRGSPELLDYSSTKGAIVSFTRSLAHSLVEKKIRVNGVAPGPIWTPLIPSTFPGAKVETFGSDVPMGRAGQPSECAPCYVFLASNDSSYITGQVLHPNGGEIVNG